MEAAELASREVVRIVEHLFELFRTLCFVQEKGFGPDRHCASVIVKSFTCVAYWC